MTPGERLHVWTVVYATMIREQMEPTAAARAADTAVDLAGARMTKWIAEQQEAPDFCPHGINRNAAGAVCLHCARRGPRNPDAIG